MSVITFIMLNNRTSQRIKPTSPTERPNSPTTLFSGQKKNKLFIITAFRGFISIVHFVPTFSHYNQPLTPTTAMQE